MLRISFEPNSADWGPRSACLRSDFHLLPSISAHPSAVRFSAQPLQFPLVQHQQSTIMLINSCSATAANFRGRRSFPFSKPHKAAPQISQEVCPIDNVQGVLPHGVWACFLGDQPRQFQKLENGRYSSLRACTGSTVAAERAGT
jgi:hypothetical protein